MKMVARVVRWQELSRVRRVARHGIEIDDGVEVSRGANECIDGRALRFELRRVGRARSRRRQRRADDDEPAIVGAINELPVALNDVVGTHAVADAPPDVVDALEEDDVRYAWS